MTRSITIEVNVPIFQELHSPIAFIFKNRKKNIHSIIMPNIRTDNIIIEGTKFHYNKKNYLYKIWGKGPILAEMFLFVSKPKFNKNDLS